MAGGVDCFKFKPAKGHNFAGCQVFVSNRIGRQRLDVHCCDQVALNWIDKYPRLWVGLGHCCQLCDMVEVVVGQDHRFERRVKLSKSLQQWPHWATGIDHYCAAAGGVNCDECVRQPVRVL